MFITPAVFLVVVVTVFPFLVFLILLVLVFTAGLGLKLFETQRIILESLYIRLLLLHDGKEGIFSNLGRHIPYSVGVLNRNEVLVGGSNLHSY
jgi:hypothetical protein